MPNCKRCGSRISKFDKDICPVCGFEHPLNDVKSNTIEITSEISISKESINYKYKTRLTTFILFFLCGFLGVGYFYLSYKKRGIIWCILNLLIITGIILLLYFACNLELVLAILIPIIAAYLINAAIGLFYLLKSDIKDGNGDFLR